MFGTYNRLNLPVSASNLEVIRKARTKLTYKNRVDPMYRRGRKMFYRAMLDHHKEARALYRSVMGGV